MGTKQLCVLVLASVWSLPVAAEERGPFVLMDRQTGGSRIGLDSSLVFPRDVDAYGVRFDAHAQFLTRSRIGGYAHFGVTYLQNQGITESDIAPGVGSYDQYHDPKINSPTAGTNLEVGAFYLLGVPEAALDITFHAGGVFPTGPSARDWNSLANLFTFMARISDFEQVSPSMGWIRGGVIASGERDWFFYQVDVSASAGFSKEEELDNFGLFHVNVGVGGRFGPVRTMAELANIATISSGDDAWAHALALGLSYGSGRFRPRFSYMLPFGEGGVFGHVFLLGFTWSLTRPDPVLAGAPPAPG